LKHQRRKISGKQEKASLRKRNITEENFTSLSNLIAESVMVVDKTGKICAVNKHVEEITELNRAEIIGKNIMQVEIIDQENKEILFNNLRKRMEDQEIQPYEIKITVQSGKSKFLEVRGKKIKYAGESVDLVVFHDVTKSKQVQEILQNNLENTSESLRESEEKFRAISNSVRDAIILIDGEGRIGYWNPAAEKIFGYSREEARGKVMFDLLVPGSVGPEVKLAMERGLKEFSVKGKGPLTQGHVELTLQKKDGSEFPVTLYSSPIRLANTWHAVGVVKDITEQKLNEQLAKDYAERLEKDVEARTKELKAANMSLLKLERLATIGELAGMVGHDLRNPLSGIKNAVYFLKKKGNTIPDARAKLMFETIDKCIEHSNKIINDLLDYSREIHLEVQHCSPRELLLEGLSMVQIPEKVKITNNVSDGIYFEADADKIQRVFINIVKNAVDSMPDGGTIIIDCLQSNENLDFFFTDTGSGIPEEIVPNLFSPLITTKAQGMGFGLAICKRLIEAHHGKITVATSLGNGTTFKITIPTKQMNEIGGEQYWINPPESLLSTTTKT
jgi:PAS domain S-box-containing protein